MQKEFQSVKKYLDGQLGVDIGCGTNRVSPDILALDNQTNKKYTHCDVVHDCHDLEQKTVYFKGQYYTFKRESLDFIFSSHCLEDFEDIPVVFLNWWHRIRINGYMILLLPDMENGRYPKCDDPEGNPSHKTDVGLGYMTGLLDTLKFIKGINYAIVQADTIPHNESCTVDIVIKKL